MSLFNPEEHFAELPSGIRLCYATQGRETDPPVLLIAGLGLQLMYWPVELVDGLARAGHRVICFDNRDAGRSSRCNTPHPDKLDQLLARAPAGSYGIEEMADDTAALLDHLRLPSVHAVGMSMGGMIAQSLAVRHPTRVRTLTSIFSTTGHRRVGQPAPSTLWRMARARAPQTESEAIERFLNMMKHIGDCTVPNIEQHWARYAAWAWRRNGERADARAYSRQIGAILKSADRTPSLRHIGVPTLVVHGDEDRMVHPSGGLATARAIANARHVVLPGMRHQVDGRQSERLVPLVLDHVRAT